MAVADAPLLAADGTPLKKCLQQSLRMQKLRALMLIAPLLAFILLTFVIPIGNMLFRSVENAIVENIIPRTVASVEVWPGGEGALPDGTTFKAAYYDLFSATEAKMHTRLGSRLNYEQSGIASLFRQTGRGLDDLGKDYRKELTAINPAWGETETFLEIFGGGDLDDTAHDSQQNRLEILTGKAYAGGVVAMPAQAASDALPLTAGEITYWALFMNHSKGKAISATDADGEKIWEIIYVALVDDLKNSDNAGAIANYGGSRSNLLRDTARAVASWPEIDYTAILTDIHDGWGSSQVWTTIKTHSSYYTSGYFLGAVDMQKTIAGPARQSEDKRILIKLFVRTIQMSLIITIMCIALGYPVAWLLANLPLRTSNVLMILVLLPFWTSLLVRTSAWKVMLQQQGVINEILVWLGFVADDGRLEIINNQFGTIVAMTHILLPFMILPLYSVMQTIPPSYVRAARSLGATNWTAFWRVYFPQSVPGIGAGSILVFILSIGYYITPEIVGGTDGVFISNRIAYHISSSLNWGLAAALGTILLVAVLVLYWAYDRIVGIDNVKLG